MAQGQENRFEVRSRICGGLASLLADTDDFETLASSHQRSTPERPRQRALKRGPFLEVPDYRTKRFRGDEALTNAKLLYECAVIYTFIILRSHNWLGALLTLEKDTALKEIQVERRVLKILSRLFRVVF